VSDARESRAESETEVLPAVGSGEGVARTQELPVVQDETVVTPPPLQDQTVMTPPPVQPPPGSAPATAPPAAPAPAPPRPAAAGSGRGRGWRNAFLALVALLVVAAVAGVVARGRLGTAAPARSGSSTAVVLPATITSVDPSGGSGFRQESGSTWRTQTYQSAEFGHLKDGVGLLLDLRSGREVASVTLDVVGGPVAVELRAGDERAASAGGYQKVASADSASGPTTLAPKDAGKHRYWLIWVTRLGSQDGGYRAVIRDPAVKARAS
jgi:hypothetical protein